jgi:hypothetical protein
MPSAELPVDVAFDCLPLRSVGRLDVPLDASDALRSRLARLKAAMEEFGTERTYFLYNAYCVFRFANSEIAGACRFEFEGVVRTDVGDRKFQDAQLHVQLASETCGGVPPEVETWLADRVRQAVGVEFDRFIAAGQLEEHGEADITASLSGFTGINV